MMVRSSFIAIVLSLCIFGSSTNSFGESGCSPFYLHVNGYFNVSHILHASRFPIRINRYNARVQELDFETPIELPVDYKRFTTNCEKVFVTLYKISHLEQLQHLQYNLTNHLKMNHRPNSDRFIFIVASEAVQTHIMSAGLFQQFKYSSVLTAASFEGHPSISAVENEQPSKFLQNYLREQTIKVTIFSVEPYNILDKGKPVGGYFHNVLSESARYYNYTLDVEYPPFKGIIQLPNKTWIGQIGQVVYGEKDVLLGSAHTYDRDPYLDFSSSIDFAGLYFVTSFPIRKVEWAAVLFIFRLEVWLLLTVVSIFLCLLFYAFFRLQEPKMRESIYRALDLTVSPILEKDAEVLPPALEIRSLAILWMFTSLVLLNYYKMDFLAYVTFPKEEITPRTFRELSERDDYKVKLFFINGAASAFFNRTKNPVYARLGKRFFRERNKVACLSSAAFDPKTACIVWDMISTVNTAKNLTLNAGFSPYEMSRDASLSVAMSLAFTKHSKYAASLSRAAGHFRDTGHIQKWKSEAYEIRRKEGREWLQKAKDDIYVRLKILMNSRTSADFKKLEFENVEMGFLQLVLGLVISGFVFVVEAWPKISNLILKKQKPPVTTPQSLEGNYRIATPQEE